MKVSYTKSGQDEIEAYKNKQVEMLVERIVDRKSVYGDEEVEITASDIREASARLASGRSSILRKRSVLFLAAKLYVWTGIFVVSGSFLYPQIEILYQNNQKQMWWGILGLCMIFLGIVAGIVANVRMRQMEEGRLVYERFLLSKAEETRAKR